jgi:hypothetical protein
MPTVQGEKSWMLWIAGWNTSIPPSTDRCFWNGSRMSAECRSSAAMVRADTPATFSSYAMKACAMCFNCSSTWLEVIISSISFVACYMRRELFLVNLVEFLSGLCSLGSDSSIHYMQIEILVGLKPNIQPIELFHDLTG